MIGPNFDVSLPAGDRSRPFSAGSSVLEALRSGTGFIRSAWTWLKERKMAQFNSKRLRLIETISLGDKRFVAVIQVDEVQFLIGGGPAAVALLAELDGQETIDDVMAKATVVRNRRRPQEPRANANEQIGVGS